MITNRPFSRPFSLFIIACFILSALPGKTQGNEKITSEILERLKQRTVLFILPTSEYNYLEDYQELLPKAWTLTPIKVARWGELQEFQDSINSMAVFMIGGIRKSSSSHTSTHYFLTLTLPNGTDRKGKLKADELCRIEMYPDFKLTQTSFGKSATDDLYTKGTFRNFRLPYMLAYLRFVQNNLKNSSNPWVYKNYSDAALKRRLFTDTLYVPVNMIFDRNKFNGKEEEKEKEFFQAYGGKYKYVDIPELIEMIKNQKATKPKPIFLFEYILSSTDKYVGVLDINTGTIVYRDYTPMSYNIKEKDIKRIID